MDVKEWALEMLKTLATIAVPYFALLKTRTDLDRFAASQRAKDSGNPAEMEIRQRWYHGLKPRRKK